MPNWFYTDNNGNKIGPMTNAQLATLVRQGIVVPETLLETDTGHKGKAGQVKGLFVAKPVAPPPVQPLADTDNLDALLDSLAQTPQETYVPNSAVATTRQRSKKKEGDIFTWYRPGDPRAPFGCNYLFLWQAIHAIGSKCKAFYFVLPLLVAVPLGFILGLVTSLIPFVLINWLILFVVCACFGTAIFECFRLAGINVKLLSMGYGFLIGLLVGYFYFAGGLLSNYNRNAAKDTPPLGIVQAITPSNVVWYVKTTAETMQIGKAGQVLMDNAPPPNRFLNYLFIFIDLIVIVVMVCAGSGGGRQMLSSGD
jgi:hypothetical protein